MPSRSSIILPPRLLPSATTGGHSHSGRARAIQQYRRSVASVAQSTAHGLDLWTRNARTSPAGRATRRAPLARPPPNARKGVRNAKQNQPGHRGKHLSRRDNLDKGTSAYSLLVAWAVKGSTSFLVDPMAPAPLVTASRPARATTVRLPIPSRISASQ
ncbi:hypothetical protein THAOC_11395 [Thalassiosira oceanica]|uniref:Uncharacterized protein n=1 Tax=Thalassiosira oceanica TaxID=159749 RepID=K0TAL9_THAOC|nr:hypothetical protein THAOC_11395 [Thalassiosira oceanica]|eukprot:EJK67552.1 hypothetical protein THAOC_11395 [Thalassiosira oceanica]